MRTNIEIDDKLLKEVMKGFGFRTKREAVEEGLHALKRRLAYQRLLELGGALRWEGDLEAMRLDKPRHRK